MTTNDALKSALTSLRQSKTRSILTMLGIVIGIASVILLMSLGQTAQQLILSQVQNTGSNLIFIIPGATKGGRFSSPASVQGVVIKTLNKQDLDALSQEPSIAGAAAQVTGQAKAVFENNDTNVTYLGVSAEFFAIRNFTTERGTVFTKSDVESLNRVAVVGQSVATTLFGSRDPVGKTIRLRDTTFRVVGLLDKKGVGPFGVDQDSAIVIPISVAQKQLLGIDHYNLVTVQGSDDYNIEFTKQRVTSILRQNHRITDPDRDDFTVRTQEDALALLGSITSVMTLFLTSIASISLVVGGIGIMNIMLVSVIERTREIGLRKAVGATDSDILKQFLWESVVLTFVGGIAGIVIGAAIVILLYFIFIHFIDGWVFSLPASAIGLGVAVSTITGIAFGIYPARQAARKNPIEALRYE